MNQRLLKLLPWVGYPAFYLVCFFLFAYLTFPYEHLRDRIVSGFADEQRKSGGGMRLEIDSITSYWLSGVEMRGIRLISPPSSAPDGTRRPASEMQVDRLTARVSILPLLIGRLSVSATAKAFGGSIEASSDKKGEDRRLEVDVRDVAIGRFDPLVQLVGLPMSGEVKGHVELSLPDGKLAKANGAVQLTFVDYAVGDGKTKIKDTIALPKMNVGDLVLECDVKDGQLRLSKLAAAGQDLDLSADGKIALRDPWAESQADLFVRFRFSDAYKNRNDTTRGLFGAPGTNAPALFELADPRIRTSKRPDGFYSWHASGQLRSMRFDPAPAGGAAPAIGSPMGGAIRGFARP
jgi:type II secretion system protein N